MNDTKKIRLISACVLLAHLYTKKNLDLCFFSRSGRRLTLWPATVDGCQRCIGDAHRVFNKLPILVNIHNMFVNPIAGQLRQEHSLNYIRYPFRSKKLFIEKKHRPFLIYIHTYTYTIHSQCARRNIKFAVRVQRSKMPTNWRLFDIQMTSAFFDRKHVLRFFYLYMLMWRENICHIFTFVVFFL